MLFEIRYTVGDISGEDVKRVQAHPVGSDEANQCLFPFNVKNEWIVDRYDITPEDRAWIRILEATEIKEETMEDTIFTGVNWAEKVNDMLSDLNAGTNAHPYSGLMAESVEDCEACVRVFDDYASQVCSADQVLKSLSDACQVNWNEPNPLEEIWVALKICEI